MERSVSVSVWGMNDDSAKWGGLGIVGEATSNSWEADARHKVAGQALTGTLAPPNRAGTVPSDTRLGESACSF